MAVRLGTLGEKKASCLKVWSRKLSQEGRKKRTPPIKKATPKFSTDTYTIMPTYWEEEGNSCARGGGRQTFPKKGERKMGQSFLLKENGKKKTGQKL